VGLESFPGRPADLRRSPEPSVGASSPTTQATSGLSKGGLFPLIGYERALMVIRMRPGWGGIKSESGGFATAPEPRALPRPERDDASHRIYQPARGVPPQAPTDLFRPSSQNGRRTCTNRLGKW
jgi:hypothetical protein